MAVEKAITAIRIRTHLRESGAIFSCNLREVGGSVTTAARTSSNAAGNDAAREMSAMSAKNTPNAHAAKRRLRDGACIDAIRKGGGSRASRYSPKRATNLVPLHRHSSRSAERRQAIARF